MPPKPFSQQEQELYKHNVEFFIDNLLNEKIDYEAINGVKISGGYDLKIDEFKVAGLSRQQNEAIKTALQQFLYDIISNLNFVNPDELGITLKDYIDYVYKHKASKD